MAKIETVTKDDACYYIVFRCDKCKIRLDAHKGNQIPDVFGEQCALCGKLTKVTANDIAYFLLERALEGTECEDDR